MVLVKQASSKHLPDLFINKKFDSRRSYKQGSYQITVAKKIISNNEFIIKLIDTEGYDKTSKNWYKPYKRLIKNSYQMTFDQKRTVLVGRVDTRERSEYDSNV